MVQLFYVSSWKGTVRTYVVISGVIRVVVELAVKIVILMLVQQFGACITVKTSNLASGDLIIVGSDSEGRETF